MCGNDHSIVIDSSSDFRQQIRTQIRENRKIELTNYQLSIPEINNLRTVNSYSLQEINLKNCNLMPSGLEVLLKVEMPNLKILSLNHNQLGAYGCKLLADCHTTYSIESLSLDNNQILDEGANYLSLACPQLNDLSLNNNAITNQGVMRLQNKIAKLEYLSIGGNFLSDQTISLINLYSTDKLLFLKISKNKISDEGLVQLLGAQPQLQILFMDRNEIKNPRSSYDKPGLYLFY